MPINKMGTNRNLFQFLAMALLLLFNGQLHILAMDPDPKTPDYLPQIFLLHIGGFLGGFKYSVEFRMGKLTYHSQEMRPGGKELTKEITPSPEQWLEFWKAAEKAKAKKWAKEYQNRNVADGTQWHFIIEHNSIKLDSQGSNSFPKSENPAIGNENPTYTLLFEEFTKAVSRLLGGLPFE